MAIGIINTIRFSKLHHLRGGAGVLHLGYWAPKMPGISVSRYWNNRMGNEYIQFVDKEDVKSNVSQFNAEYDEIENKCKHLLNSLDFEMLEKHIKHFELPRTFNSEYTLIRESLLFEKAIQNYSIDIGFTIKTKIYTFFRLWVTGVNKTHFEKEKSVFRKLILIYPFLISFVMFVLLLFSLPFLLVKMKVKKVYFLVSILLYIGLMYVPFTIQARYTIPVRLIQIMLISGVINWLIKKWVAINPKFDCLYFDPKEENKF